MNRRAALEIVRTVLAADCACQPEDWQRDAVTVVEAREMVGRRRFSFHAPEFILRTMGCGAVISCSADRLAWARAELGSRTKDELFLLATLVLINQRVAADGQRLDGPSLNYLCTDEDFRAASLPVGFTLEYFGPERMTEAYAYTGFGYALSYDLAYPRPDMIAVAAWHDGQVIGLAGASADSDEVWQVGVSVLPAYHRMGIGKALVSQVTEMTLAQGKVPHYATWIANLASSNTARTLGYWLAWTDVCVRDT
jgi:GNAT superfamily N-acetyltransferase